MSLNDVCSATADDWTLHLLDSSPTVWSFRPTRILPTGHFAYETLRLQDTSPTG